MSKSKISIDLSGMEQLVAVSKKYRTRVGILGNKAARNGDSSINNAELAVIQIFGSLTNNIPPRDFLLMPIMRNKQNIVKDMNKKEVKEAIDRSDWKTVYKLLGVIAEGYIDQAFQTAGFGTWPPNKPSTIARKGSSAPLIHTSQLRRAVTSDVVTGNKQ